MQKAGASTGSRRRPGIQKPILSLSPAPAPSKRDSTAPSCTFIPLLFTDSEQGRKGRPLPPRSCKILEPGRGSKCTVLGKGRQFIQPVTKVNALSAGFTYQLRMSSFPPSQSLWPEDLRVAANAFEQALQAIPPEAHELEPHTARQLVARYVMDKTLNGVRDPVRLREGALQYVSLIASKQTA
jgi:hypothetical protein